MKKFFIFLFWTCSIWSQNSVVYGSDTLRCRICFPAGCSTIDLSYRNNSSRLNAFVAVIHSRQETAVVHRVSLHSGALPGEIFSLNQRLCQMKRLASLRSILQERLSLPDSVFTITSLGDDWEGLISLVGDSDMPYREEVLRILRNTPVWETRNGVVVNSRKRQLMDLRGGEPWRYMLEHFFPKFHNTSVIECEFESVATEKDKEPLAGQTDEQLAGQE